MAKEEFCSNNVNKLPPELWGEIGKRIGNQVDLQVFRSTCESWRAHLPSPSLSLFPLQVPSPPRHHLSRTSTSSTFDYKYYIAEHTGYLIKSETDTDPNMVVFESKLGGDGRVFFPFRLLVDRHFTKDIRPQKLDLQTLPTSFVFKTYYLQVYHGFPEAGVGETSSIAQKLVLLSYFTNTNRSTGINPLFATSCGVDLAAVALLPKGDLAHVALNNNNYDNPPVEWKLLGGANRFDDIINYGGKLWGVDLDGGAFTMEDFHSLKITQAAASPVIFIQGKSYIRNAESSHLTPIASPFYETDLKVSRESHFDDDSRFKGRKRLIECSGMLYMLFPCRTNNIELELKLKLNHGFELELEDDLHNDIKVFQLTLTKGGLYPYEWVEVKSIGSDKAFFVGLSFGFSMAVGPEMGLIGNSIYLNGNSFCRSGLANLDWPLFEDMAKPGPSAGIYTLMDNEFRTITPLDSPLIYCTILPSSLRYPEVPKPEKSRPPLYHLYDD